METAITLTVESARQVMAVTHAAAGKTHPALVLQGVHLALADGQLAAETSDRCCAAQTKVAPASAPEDAGEWLVPAVELRAALKKALAALRRDTDGRVRLTFTDTAERPTPQFPTIWEIVADGHTQTTSRGECIITSAFPELSRLFQGELATVEVGTALNAQLLETATKIAEALKAGKDDVPLVRIGQLIRKGEETGPMLATIGAVALLMQPNSTTGSPSSGLGTDWRHWAAARVNARAVESETTASKKSERDAEARRREIARLEQRVKELEAGDSETTAMLNAKVAALTSERDKVCAERDAALAEIAALHSAPTMGDWRGELAKIANVTEKMADRVAIALSKALPVDDVLKYALGTHVGQRADKVRAALAKAVN